MLIKCIQRTLAQVRGALNRYPLFLVLDRSLIHNKPNILDNFHDNGCQELAEVWKMLTKAAKRIQPLDTPSYYTLNGEGEKSRANH
jgi:hypothetical protein